MKRKIPSILVPDAINCSPIGEHTLVPNGILRDSTLSFKAKGLLCLLLSNKEGWQSHITTIIKMGKDGKSGIQSGLTELETAGYFRRIRYRNSRSKVWEGSFWIYTNDAFVFDVEKQLKLLKTKGYEPQPDFPALEKPEMENQPLKILINKNINKKEKNNTKKDLMGEIKTKKAFRPSFSRWMQYKKNRKQSYQDSDSLQLAYDKLVRLSNNDPDAAMPIVEQAMSNNWAGLFPLRDEGSSGAKRKTNGSRQFQKGPVRKYDNKPYMED